MKKLILLFLVITYLPAAAQEGKTITILFTNDLHSRLNGYSPESAYTPLITGDDSTVGGFARIASIIRNEKNASGGTTVVVDAGDFLMGTLFQTLEPETGFQLNLMKSMGYDAVAVGNHEFDFGPGKLASILRVASENGNIPAILLGNAVFSSDDASDDALSELASQDILKRKFVLVRDGIRFGFFSLLGKVADENAAYAPPVEFSKQVAAARKIVKELEDENCDIIICLSHSGVEMKNGEWGGEDVELASKVKGIDVVISGHTHTKLTEPVLVGGTPVVQSGEYAQNLGKLTIELNGKNVRVVDYKLIPVNDKVAGDPDIHFQIRQQQAMVQSLILEPLDLKYDTPVAETDFLLQCQESGDFMNSNMAPLVADAIHSIVNKHSTLGTDISMVAVGVVRDWLVPGRQSPADVFRVMSMGSGDDNVPGYPLARVYVTGRELKSILEILMIAWKSAPSNYCYYSGIRVKYNPDRGFLKKISDIELTGTEGNPVKVDFSKKNKSLYSITANSYMLEFVGIIKKMSFGLINVVPKDFEGNAVTDMKTAVIDIDEKEGGIQEGKEWLAILEYLGSMKDVNGNGIPDIDKKYTTSIKTFFLEE